MNANLTLSKILIVDDDRVLRDQLGIAFQKKFFQTWKADNADSAYELISKQDFSHALIDLKMSPGDSGLKVLEYIVKTQALVKCVVLTGFGSINTAVEAIKLGAVNYLTKPAKFEDILNSFDGKLGGKDQLPSLQEVSLEYVNRVLMEYNGNITKSAKVLGLHRRSLQRKLTK